MSQRRSLEGRRSCSAVNRFTHQQRQEKLSKTPLSLLYPPTICVPANVFHCLRFPACEGLKASQWPERRISDKDCEGKQVRTKRGVNDPETGGNRSTKRIPHWVQRGREEAGVGQREEWGRVPTSSQGMNAVCSLYFCYIIFDLLLHKTLCLCVEAVTFTVKI